MNYPFGRPVTARPPTSAEHRPLFVLGAYPSALHVQWTPPKDWDGFGITAMPVDDEPTPFWDGTGEDELVAAWRDDAFSDKWGTATPAGNGTTGRALDKHYLQPLKFDRAQTCFTDCVDTYCASESSERALKERFDPFAAARGMQSATLLAHRDENAIVREAIADHLPRLRAELQAASPTVVVTLGSAASRVFAAVLGLPDPGGLQVEGYGAERTAIVADHPVTWLALAHPRARQQTLKWTQAHDDWVSAQ